MRISRRGRGGVGPGNVRSVNRRVTNSLTKPISRSSSYAKQHASLREPIVLPNPEIPEFVLQFQAVQQKLANFDIIEDNVTSIMNKEEQLSMKDQLKQIMQIYLTYYGKTIIEFSGAMSTYLASLNQKIIASHQRTCRLLDEVQNTKGNILVYVRVRPPLEAFDEVPEQCIIKNYDEVSMSIGDSKSSSLKAYEFDRCFEPAATQQQIYEQMEYLPYSIMQGYNVSILAYGQTGSGKTHTMFGPDENKGLNFRLTDRLFELISHSSNKVTVSLSMLEIYNETVYDLLSLNEDTKVELKSQEISGLTEHSLNKKEDINYLYNLGIEHRSTASTVSNEDSSRSHCIIIITVNQTDEEDNNIISKLYLVDLAGSERVAKSGVEGDRLTEANYINKSLTALSDVLQALDKKDSHIPYRNSKLTFLLQESLSSNSKTVLLCTLCPTSKQYGETISTLDFATRVKNINFGSAKRHIEIQNNKVQNQQLQSQLKDYISKDEFSKKRIQELQTQLKTAEDKLNTQNKKRESMINNQNNEYQKKYEGILQLYQKCRKDVVDLKTEKDNLAMTVQNQALTITRNQNKESEMSHMIEQKDDEIAKLKVKLRNRIPMKSSNTYADKEKKIQILTEDLEKCERERKALRQELSGLKNSYKETSSNQTRVRKELERAKKEIESLEEELSRLRKRKITPRTDSSDEIVESRPKKITTAKSKPIVNSRIKSSKITKINTTSVSKSTPTNTTLIKSPSETLKRNNRLKKEFTPGRTKIPEISIEPFNPKKMKQVRSRIDTGLSKKKTIKKAKTPPPNMDDDDDDDDDEDEEKKKKINRSKSEPLNLTSEYDNDDNVKKHFTSRLVKPKDLNLFTIARTAQLAKNKREKLRNRDNISKTTNITSHIKKPTIIEPEPEKEEPEPQPQPEPEEEEEEEQQQQQQETSEEQLKKKLEEEGVEDDNEENISPQLKSDTKDDTQLTIEDEQQEKISPIPKNSLSPNMNTSIKTPSPIKSSSSLLKSQKSGLRTPINIIEMLNKSKSSQSNNNIYDESHSVNYDNLDEPINLNSSQTYNGNSIQTAASNRSKIQPPSSLSKRSNNNNNNSIKIQSPSSLSKRSNSNNNNSIKIQSPSSLSKRSNNNNNNSIKIQQQQQEKEEEEEVDDDIQAESAEPQQVVVGEEENQHQSIEEEYPVENQQEPVEEEYPVENQQEPVEEEYAVEEEVPLVTENNDGSGAKEEINEDLDLDLDVNNEENKEQDDLDLDLDLDVDDANTEDFNDINLDDMNVDDVNLDDINMDDLNDADLDDLDLGDVDEI